MPSAISCTPPMSQMESMVLAQPATACPAIWEMRVYSAARMAAAANTKPTAVTMRMGLMENDVTPCMAKASIFLSGYLLSPASRSPRS